MADDELDTPISHAVADGWADFAHMGLPSIGGGPMPEVHIAFYFGAFYVLQILERTSGRTWVGGGSSAHVEYVLTPSSRNS